MNWQIVAAAICGVFFLVGSMETVYQVYHITMIDAKSRGFQHPKFWGFFAAGGNNGSGLFLYLLKRKQYPIQNLSEEDKKEIQSRKKSAGMGLLYSAIGAIGLILSIMNL